MTRVREEIRSARDARGVLPGLAVTGGVITSAGLVLAATFAVLDAAAGGVRRVGFAVALGVLIDTIIVRSLLVTALAYDIGPHIWWPSKLAHPERQSGRTTPPCPPEREAVTDGT